MHPTGLAAHPLEWTGDRDRGDHLAGGRAHAGRHRSDAGLALADALRPAATPDARQRGGVVLGAVQAAVQPVGSSQASRICAAEPASMLSWLPTGIESRRPDGRSAAATQTRKSPWRRNSCADSPVMSRSRASTGPAAASSRSSPAADDSSPRRGPSMKRPCMSRATRRWCSRATASRWAVGRASPVAVTSPANVAGPDSRAESTRAALSSTPTPLELAETSIPRYCRLKC